MSKERFRYATTSIENNIKVRLRDEVLTSEKPIGGSVLELHGNQDKELYQYLFDGHSRFIYEQKGERPSIIVGRKGAGKTTYLNNLSFKSGVTALPIRQWQAIGEVQQIISNLLDNGIDIRAERASYIWQWIFLSAVILKCGETLFSDKTLKDFYQLLPVKEFKDIGISAVTSFAKNKLSKLVTNNLGAEHAELSSVAWLLEDKTQAIDDLEMKLSNTLGEHNLTAIILFDNEEDVLDDINIENAPNLQIAKAIAIKGLLNLAGRINEGAINVQLRYCIPAEQFFAFKELAKNPVKDFGRLHLLHWTVGELLSLVAHRFLLHLHVWKDEKPILGGPYDELIQFPIYTRKGALEFFDKILPTKIKNGRGLEESTKAYFLRHFQVLPRQIVDVFNEILAMSIRNNKSITNLDAQIVLGAVRRKEALMAEEIIVAYSKMFPEASSIRKKVLPNIPLLFTYKDLRKFYDSREFLNTGKSVLQGMKGEVEVSPDRFERCLLETGIIGRVISKPSGNDIGYINAEFEYSMPGSLDLCENDELVIHPVFSGQRKATAWDAIGKNIIGVYPHDADPDLSADRELLRCFFV
ncbi:hypothetical protein Q4520_01830 [Alteromonas sp. 1_MG-2023]|uniref:P-loop ATPase, Sll1717 family n=1 Tax=Alteromonas sp. 1_MG-2023 TaxID=3062669 RepID=UPI0026E369CC|nr:hypothetical protein [Alteromonas sp. 1_MG-2023]MDO6474134.1 hypothetical protein [Alteromonas sp. 1_MG-2023]